MRPKYLFVLFVLFLSCGKSNKEKVEAKKFESTIEYSIKQTSQCVNPVIKELNKFLIGQTTKDRLSKLFLNAKKSIVINKKVVNTLKEFDPSIELKKETIRYMTKSADFLRNFIQPMLETSKKNFPVDKNRTKKLFDELNEMMLETQNMSDLLKHFCDEHEIEMGIDEFEIDSYESKVNEVKSILNE